MTGSICTRYQTLAQQNAISNQQLATQAAKVKSDEGVVETDKAAVQCRAHQSELSRASCRRSTARPAPSSSSPAM